MENWRFLWPQVLQWQCCHDVTGQLIIYMNKIFFKNNLDKICEPFFFQALHKRIIAYLATIPLLSWCHPTGCHPLFSSWNYTFNEIHMKEPNCWYYYGSARIFSRNIQGGSSSIHPHSFWYCHLQVYILEALDISDINPKAEEGFFPSKSCSKMKDLEIDLYLYLVYLFILPSKHLFCINFDAGDKN